MSWGSRARSRRRSGIRGLPSAAMDSLEPSTPRACPAGRTFSSLGRPTLPGSSPGLTTSQRAEGG
eukprot:scaffold1925_cov28-Phaeocystis_antarctica.AAC.1